MEILKIFVFAFLVFIYTSCQQKLTDKFLMDVNEIHLEYEIVSWDEFLNAPITPKPEDIALICSFRNKSKRTEDTVTCNSLAVWAYQNDTILLTSYGKNIEVYKNEELKVVYHSNSDDYSKLKDILLAGDTHSIIDKMRSSNFVLVFRIGDKKGLKKAPMKNSKVIFNFSDKVLSF